jgi:mRNA interferase MazF
MGMVIQQYHVYLVDLDPTKGHEIKKTRPCLIISPDEMNDAIGTVIIAPMTTKSHAYPTRIVLDQIRTIDKTRLIKNIGKIGNREKSLVKKVIQEMLVD